MASRKARLWGLAATALVLAAAPACAAPSGGATLTRYDYPTPKQVEFLQRYGYLAGGGDDEGGEAALTPQSVSEAVAAMQRYAGLPATGLIDHATLKLFESRRCGVRDVRDARGARGRRHVPGAGWDKNLITYRVLNGSSNFEKSKVEEYMSKGFALWAPHGQLTFETPSRGPVDVEILFAAGDHGDMFAFDGRGNVVAHAFGPPLGAMHFDDDELWGENPDGEDDNTTDFFMVAAHEIGHVLGLGHSSARDSIMYPYYKLPVTSLSAEDVQRMRDLYLPGPAGAKVAAGAAAGTESPVPTYTRRQEPPDPCLPAYDTIAALNNFIYLIKDQWVWVYVSRKHLDSSRPYPIRLEEVFPLLPPEVTSVDALYQDQHSHVRLFSGRKYWEYSLEGRQGRLVRAGELAEYGLPPSLARLSAAFLSNVNNKTYLFGQDRFWRYDERLHTMDAGYPRSVRAWRRVPPPIRSAIVWDGDTFLFNGGRFWRFDNIRVRAHESYPVPVAQLWLGCPPSPDMMRYTTN